MLKPFSLFLSAFGLALVFATSACVTSDQVPLEEYTLARAAYEAAKDADALRYAPSLWYTAEENYREAQRAFKERRYGKADKLFGAAREAAEKAENAARLARHQAGDS